MSAHRDRRIRRLLERAQQELDGKKVRLAEATRAELRSLQEELCAAEASHKAIADGTARLARSAEAVEWAREAVWQTHLHAVHEAAAQAHSDAVQDVAAAREAVHACMRRAAMFDALLARMAKAQKLEASRMERRAEDEWAGRTSQRDLGFPGAALR